MIVLSAVVAVVMVGLLDLLAPADASFGWLYVAPVVMMGWAYGWRGAVLLAALASATELLVDAPMFRESEIGEPSAILAWNALSSFLAFAVAGVVTDRFYSERERWKTVSAERTRLLRLLEREFPRPLRAIDWFARTFEEAVDSRTPMPPKLREQFSGLRHHSRELRFLATDLLRIGRLGGRELEFERVSFDLGALVKEAADETVDRNRVVVRTLTEHIYVSADPEAVRHATSSVIGRLIDVSPTELVDVLVRASGDEAAVELTTRGGPLAIEDLELADLLLTENGGRMTIAPKTQGARIHLYLPRAVVPDHVARADERTTPA